MVPTAGWWNSSTLHWPTPSSRSARPRPCFACARAWTGARWSASSPIAHRPDRRCWRCRSSAIRPRCQPAHWRCVLRWPRQSYCSTEFAPGRGAMMSISSHSPTASCCNAHVAPRRWPTGCDAMRDGSRHIVAPTRSTGSTSMTSGTTGRIPLHRRGFALLLMSTTLLPLGRVMAAESSTRRPEGAIDELMQMLARVPESSASFAEVKVIAMLTRPLHATGRLLYRRPAHLEKVTLEPQPERLVVDGNRLTLTEANETPRIIDLDAEPAIRALVDAIRGTLSGDLAALRRSYAVTMEGGVSDWRLTLTPSDPGVARLVTRTTIAGAGTALRLVQTTQANGDEIRMTIGPAP